MIRGGTAAFFLFRLLGSLSASFTKQPDEPSFHALKPQKKLVVRYFDGWKGESLSTGPALVICMFDVGGLFL